MLTEPHGAGKSCSAPTHFRRGEAVLAQQFPTSSPVQPKIKLGLADSCQVTSATRWLGPMCPAPEACTVTAVALLTRGHPGALGPHLLLGPTLISPLAGSWPVQPSRAQTLQLGGPGLCLPWTLCLTFLTCF